MSVGTQADRAGERGSNDLFAQAARGLLASFRAQRPLRARSLIVSVFGDAISPHGGIVWLGSLIQALAPFGVSQRLVRTSVYRLVQDDWLEAEQIGRRSFYRLTAHGRQNFREASRRIYGEPRQVWPGTWCLVLLSGLEAGERELVRKELRWLGFAPFATNLMAHPCPDRAALDDHLDASGYQHKTVVMEGRVLDGQGQSCLREMVQDCWALDQLDTSYAAFTRRFRPVFNGARGATELEAGLAFQVRTLLIHEYRKILLRDPFLPASLLPEGWNGIGAYQLCRNLYSIVAGPAMEFLMAEMETADGPLPPAEPGFFARFGGFAGSAAGPSDS